MNSVIKFPQVPTFLARGGHLPPESPRTCRTAPTVLLRVEDMLRTSLSAGRRRATLIRQAAPSPRAKAAIGWRGAVAVVWHTVWAAPMHAPQKRNGQSTLGLPMHMGGVRQAARCPYDAGEPSWARCRCYSSARQPIQYTTCVGLLHLFQKVKKLQFRKEKKYSTCIYIYCMILSIRPTRVY